MRIARSLLVKKTCCDLYSISISSKRNQLVYQKHVKAGLNTIQFKQSISLIYLYKL